jgi:hypothetical protein
MGTIGIVESKERCEMASTAVPSSGDAGVCAAVALGWQVAQLFHSPVHDGLAEDPRRGEHDHLPGLGCFPPASRSKWLGEQIQSQMKTLLDTPPQAVLDSMTNVLTALADSDRRSVTTLDAVFTLHCKLLEALTVADFRLGKAYGLGRAMAETALLPAAADTDEQTKQQFRNVLTYGRLVTMTDWLADLKTLLPAHTAYAVSRSLRNWEQWARGPRADGDWAAAHPAIQVQGRIWRQMLTGEKAARDILKLSDYHAAGVRVAKRVIVRFWWIIALAVFLIAGVIFVGSYLHNIPPSIQLVGDIAWLAGALGISLKGIGTLLGTGLKDVEGWIWQIELDGSVAAAVSHLPDGVKPSRVRSGSIGELTPTAKLDINHHQNGMRQGVARETVG